MDLITFMVKYNVSTFLWNMTNPQEFWNPKLQAKFFIVLLSGAFFEETQAQDEVVQSTVLQNTGALGFLIQVPVWYPKFCIPEWRVTRSPSVIPGIYWRRCPAYWTLSVGCFFLNRHKHVESLLYVCKTHPSQFKQLWSYKEGVPVFGRLKTLPVVNSCLGAQNSESAGWIIVVFQN